MSLPRMSVPGGTYLVTRTTVMSLFLLVAGEVVNTLTNPVKDGLVSDYRKWPGFNTRPSDWRGRVRRVRRPSFYFKDTPEELTYRVVPPAQMDRGDLEGLIANVESHIRDRQSQFAADMAAQGRRFMGAKVVRRLNPFEAPSTPRPVGPSKIASATFRSLTSGPFRSLWA